MSEEQPSRRSRVCAIRCRLFLLGYSSNIGYSLACAFRPASGTAYSSNHRAPSPRVPPGATCVRPAMRDKRSHVRRPVLHSIFAARRGRQNRRAGNMYRSSRWGAPRLRASALSCRPACAPSPLAGRNLLPSFLAAAARPRPNALTLIPPGFVLPVVALAPPRFPNCAGYPHPCAFPPLRGSLRSPLRKRLPAPLVGSATLRPRHASPRAGNMKRVGVVDDSGVQPKKTTRRR